MINCTLEQARVKLQWPTSSQPDHMKALVLALSHSPSSIYFIVLDCSHFIIFFLILKETKPPGPGPLCSRPILHLTLPTWILSIRAGLVNPGDVRAGIKLSLYSILVLKECFFCWINFFGIMPLLTPPTENVTLARWVFLPRHLLPYTSTHPTERELKGVSHVRRTHSTCSIYHKLT